MEDNNPIQEPNSSNVGQNGNYNQMNNQIKKVNQLALVSFIFSLVGLIIAGIPCGIVATITGIIGLVKFNPNTEKFKWMAIVGLIVGIVDIVLVLLGSVLLAML